MSRGITLAAVAVLLGAAADGAGPQPPCAAESDPPYPDLQHSPATKVWDRSSLGRDWMPPACLGWSAPGFTTLVSTVARFHATGMEGLLQRIGGISGLTGMRYWSTTRQSWRTLIVSASALVGPRGGSRPDFSAADLAPGSIRYFQQSDSLSGKATYRMQMVSVSPDRLVFETENVTGLRYMLVPFSAPRVTGNLFSGKGIARHLAILQHRAKRQRCQQPGGGARCIHRQPSRGVLSLLRGHPH